MGTVLIVLGAIWLLLVIMASIMKFRQGRRPGHPKYIHHVVSYQITTNGGKHVSQIEWERAFKASDQASRMRRNG